MKVIFGKPFLRRTTFFRRRRTKELSIQHTFKWYTGTTPKNKKKKRQWWISPSSGNKTFWIPCPYGIRTGCGTRKRIGLPYEKNCSNLKAPGQKPKFCHPLTWDYEPKDFQWRLQESSLCIERNLTSWIFRWRYRRNKAATLIQNWYRGLFMFRLFKRAKASFHSYASYEPARIETVCDPTREPGDEQ